MECMELKLCVSDKHHRYYKHTKFRQNPRGDPKFLVDLTRNDPRDMIALLDNVQILVISKKLVNKLHSVGFITSLWIGVTQRITNEISNFVTCSNSIT